MRRKVYTKDQILKAAHEVVLESGFEKFTARNVAKKMGISDRFIGKLWGKSEKEMFELRKKRGHYAGL